MHLDFDRGFGFSKGGGRGNGMVLGSESVIQDFAPFRGCTAAVRLSVLHCCG